MANNVQIPQELFQWLLEYHCLGVTDHAEDIRQALEDKLNRMVKHQVYTQSLENKTVKK